MASEEVKFAARADPLGRPSGRSRFHAGLRPRSQPAPTNRYIMPQFVEKTPVWHEDPGRLPRLFEDRIIFLGGAGGRRLRRRRDGPAAGPRIRKIRTVT